MNKPFFVLLFLWLVAPTGHAQTSRDVAEAQSLLNREGGLADLNSRAALVSDAFVGRPYLSNGPLGEGPDGKYDQDPLFRTDGFDCTTFVETVLALARSFNLDDFVDQLNHIRYLDGVIDFTYRNHFVEIDWNPNNEAAGFLKDVTRDVASPSRMDVAVQTVSKRAWYQSMRLQNLKLPGADAVLLQQRLTDLNHEGQRFPDVVSRLPYLKKEWIVATLSQFQGPAVINIVRDLKTAAGKTVSVVTHQVLLISKNGKNRIRQASSKSSNMKVIDQSLEAFAQDQLGSPSTRGINILKALDRN